MDEPTTLETYTCEKCGEQFIAEPDRDVILCDEHY